METFLETLGQIIGLSKSINHISKSKKQNWKNQICLGIFQYPEEHIFSPRQRLLQKTYSNKFHIKDQEKTNQNLVQEVLEHIQCLVGTNMRITQIWSFKTPLSDWKFSYKLLYHEYIVFKTQGQQKCYYWNVEKNMQRIWMSLCQKFQQARDYQHYAQYQNQQMKISQFLIRYNQEWKKPQQIKYSKSNYNLNKFIKWIYQQNLRKKKYNLMDNCQHFAQIIYTKVTQN